MDKKEKPAKVMIIHPNLNSGGVETQIRYFVDNHNINRLRLVLVLFSRSEKHSGQTIDTERIRLFTLGHCRQPNFVKRIYLLFRILLSEKPDVVYTYLPNTNIVGLLLGRLCRVRSVVWGLRVSQFRYKRFGYKGEIANLLAVFLSRKVDLLIANTWVGLNEYVSRGLAAKKSVVIPNGVDTEKFRPDKNIRNNIRYEYGIKPTELLIGVIARMVEWKGYEYFLEAARQLLSEPEYDVRFMCVGGGNNVLQEQYVRKTRHYSIANRFFWLGDRSDVARILNGLDILTLPSLEGEGFPNVIGEAMATSVPVVATDVGDVRKIIGGAGYVVPPMDPSAIVSAWKELMCSEKYRHQMGEEARRSVLSNYSITSYIERTEHELVEIGR